MNPLHFYCNAYKQAACGVLLVNLWWLSAASSLVVPGVTAPVKR